MSALLDFGKKMKPLPHEAGLRMTYLGQAHIAGTGPEGKTCRECRFFGVEKVENKHRVLVSPGHYAHSNKTKGGGN